MAYYNKGVEYIPDDKGIAIKIKCPLVDRFIEDIDCLENTSLADYAIPKEFKNKKNWKQICCACPFRDY